MTDISWVSNERKAQVLEKIVAYLDKMQYISEHNEDELDTILWMLENPDADIYDSPIIIRPEEGVQ
jgi:hypothetical protein|tara:strand:- start:64 stop:261 length:198 start_codon:yes stop_codon:yes gene_type:complete